MRAFDIQGDTVIFTPEFLAIEEFNAIWSADKSKSKATAMKELSFVVFMCDERAQNPYSGLSRDLREELLVTDLLGGVDYNKNQKIVTAINKLKLLLETTSTRLLVSAQVAADKLAGWFNKVDFDIVDDHGKQRYSASELSRNLKDVGNIVKSLKELERQVRKEQADDNVARGGAEIGMFELV